MHIGRLKELAAVGVISALCAVTCYGQKMNVKVIKRQNSETGYNYAVPGHSDTMSRTHVDCREGYSGKDCVKVTRSETDFVAPQQGSYSVTGATLSLQLPDGRVAVVNCVSKLSLFTPTPQTQRSCRIPPVDDIQVEFKGKNAKLAWPVSVDGSKLESETYKILAITDN
jgi:hypothetical protein